MTNEKNINIVVLDGHAANPGDMSWEAFRNMGNLTVYDRTAPADVVERAADADVLLTNKVLFPSQLLDALPRLKYIGVLATGYNTVDTVHAAKRGIVVTNIPAYSTESVAQMVFAHLLNIVNRVDKYADDARTGKWSQNPDFCYWDAPLTELYGKYMGIVGLGNIGKKVASIAHSFGMQVLAYTRKQQSEIPDYIEKVNLPTLYAQSDVLSLHCPLTDETAHMINTTTLSQMKPSAILINTGRGPLVDEEAVAQALHEGRLKAYGADVMTSEPPSADNSLLKEPHAFITPHIAWATVEARQRLFAIAENNLKQYLSGKPINVVNNPV